MKLFSLRLTTLKSKLYAIVFVSLIVRVVAFFALPNSASTLGPDEGEYANLVGWVAQGKAVSEYPTFGPNLFNSARSVILPSSLFYRTGLNSLDSIRLTASVYSFLTTILVLVMILKLSKEKGNASFFIQKHQTMISYLFLTFVFLPSRYTWSILGLRESSAEFWTMLVFGVIFASNSLKMKASFKLTVIFFVANIMVYSSRPQVGLVLSTALVIYFLATIKKRSSMLFMAVAIVAMVLSAATTATITTTATTATTATNPIKLLNNQSEILFAHHKANQVDAESIIVTPGCPFMTETSYNDLLCLVWRTPQTTFTFLFRPLFGADVTSLPSLFAAAENIFWLGSLLFITVILVWVRRLPFFALMAPSLIFAFIYSTTAAAYEGNMGTAFRHKSLILWVVILLLASTIVATQQRRAEQQGISGSS
jgi:hypothetical protein